MAPFLTQSCQEQSHAEQERNVDNTSPIRPSSVTPEIASRIELRVPDHLRFVSGSEGCPGWRRIQRWAAANAATPTAPVNQRARWLGRGAIAFRRIARRRSLAGIQRVKNAKASDAQCGHRSSVWSSSQSRHSRASCRCIRIVYPLGPSKLLRVGVRQQFLSRDCDRKAAGGLM